MSINAIEQKWVEVSKCIFKRYLEDIRDKLIKKPFRSEYPL